MSNLPFGFSEKPVVMLWFLLTATSLQKDEKQNEIQAARGLTAAKEKLRDTITFSHNKHFSVRYNLHVNVHVNTVRFHGIWCV